MSNPKVVRVEKARRTTKTSLAGSVKRARKASKTKARGTTTRASRTRLK